MIQRKSPSFFVSLLVWTLAAAGPARAEQTTAPAQQRPPVIYVAASGVRPGLPVGPPAELGLDPDILQGIRGAAARERIAVDVTIYPERADYILALDSSEPPWSPHQTWTLIDAASGIVLEHRRSLLLANALSQAVGAVGRRWYSELEDRREDAGPEAPRP